MSALYPAPRWFRETVQAWLAGNQAAVLPHRASDLFTRIARAQPPDLPSVGPCAKCAQLETDIEQLRRAYADLQVALAAADQERAR